MESNKIIQISDCSLVSVFRVTTNKLLLSIVILLEIAILGGLVYYKFFRKHWTSCVEGFVDQNFDPESE